MQTGIIGGADGPTVIYVASSVSLPLIAGAAIAVVVAVWLILRKRKK